MLKNLRENRKKGFTLVELIVVLVILAILAALLIPALTGYIDKAKEKQIIAETRQAVMAAQTIADEQYALETSDIGGYITTNASDVLKLADVTGSITDVTVDSDGHVTDLKFSKANGDACVYEKAGNPAYVPQ